MEATLEGLLSAPAIGARRYVLVMTSGKGLLKFLPDGKIEFVEEASQATHLRDRVHGFGLERDYRPGIPWMFTEMEV